jgi:hypothetical protein
VPRAWTVHDKSAADPGQWEASPRVVARASGDSSTPAGCAPGTAGCDRDFPVAVVASDRSTGFDRGAVGDYRVVDNYADSLCRLGPAFLAAVVPRDVARVVDRAVALHRVANFPARVFHERLLELDAASNPVPWRVESDPLLDRG